MTDEQRSIEELAECVKELCRLEECRLRRPLSDDLILRRVDEVYKKATTAKNRVSKV